MVGSLIRRGALAGVAVIGLEAAYAVLMPVPELEGLDPSGTFGDPDLPELRVAAVGDSSIMAPGVDRPEDIWVSRLCRRMATGRHVTLSSFAVGGSRASDVLRDQVEAAVASRPDLIFLSVGANDVLKGVPISRFASNLDRVVTGLARSKAVIVQSGVGVMGTIPRLYPPLSNLMSHRALRFDRVHHEVARRHMTYVVDQRSDDPSVWNHDRSLWAADLFHVSAAGHARWAETAWKTVGPIMDGQLGSG